MEDCILNAAAALVNGPRQAAYGHPFDDYTRTAKMWSAIIGVEITAEQAAMCMIAVKLSRECNAPKIDNRVDGAGYFKVLDMIIEERQRRARAIPQPEGEVDVRENSVPDRASSGGTGEAGFAAGCHRCCFGAGSTC